jgi:hypothetical protein
MGRRRRGWPLIVAAVLLFAGLRALPWMLPGGPTPAWAQAARRTTPVPLAAPPAALPPVHLSPAAQPVQPDDPPAAPPAADSTHMSALVAAEDLRLRTLQHHTSCGGLRRSDSYRRRWTWRPFSR